MPASQFCHRDQMRCCVSAETQQVIPFFLSCLTRRWGPWLYSAVGHRYPRWRLQLLCHMPRRRRHESAHVCRVTPNMPAASGCEHGWGQEEGTQSRSLTWMAGTQILELSPVASQGVYWQETGVRNQSWDSDPGTLACGHLNCYAKHLAQALSF